jgi:hypothetical protein
LAAVGDQPPVVVVLFFLLSGLRWAGGFFNPRVIENHNEGRTTSGILKAQRSRG